MMIKRLSLVGLAVAVTLTGTVIATAQSGADTTTPAQEAMRTSVATYLTNLVADVNAAAQNPSTSASVSPKAAGMLANLAQAQQQVPALTGTELDLMSNILGQDAGWQQQPVVLQQNLSNTSVKAPARLAPAGVLSDCSVNNGDPRGLFYSYWAAAQIASAANAVASGIPSAVDFVAATIIAGVAFGVANGIAIGLGYALGLSLDCSAAVSNAALSAAFPRDSSNNVIPASSQADVNALAALSAQIENTLNQIQTDVAAINSKLTTVIDNVGVAQGTSNNTQVIAQDLQERTNALLNSVGGARDMATDPTSSADTANGIANLIASKLDTITSNTTNFQQLSVRMEIETTLANGAPPPALFEEPPSEGGYLETVGAIVTTVATDEANAGQSVGTAESLIAAGNDAYAASQYATAYKEYQYAYFQATK